MNTQLPLAVQLAPEFTLEDFIPGENAQLMDALQRLALGKEKQNLYLSGPTASGKSHLLMGLCASAQNDGLHCVYLPLKEIMPLSAELLQGMEDPDLLAIDDVQVLAGKKDWEEALFVLFNLRQTHGRPMVFSADRGPARLPLNLPDLRSRLGWGASYRLHPLDEAGLGELLRRQARQRGLEMDQAAIDWLLSRHSRAPRALLEQLEALDRAALITKKSRLTLPFVQQQLSP
ncbi:DnaA regulatory inactivator Hda [Thiolapillus sp.]